MSGDAVARLRLRGPAGAAGRARQQVEDALRLAPRPTDRLLVARRLSLGRHRLGPTSAPLAATAAARLAEIGRRAVHGGAASGDAEAVWFASVEEARRLLILRLAAGRPATEWFWRLAAPDWRGRALGAYLPDLFIGAAAGAEAKAAMARLLVAALRAGALPALTRALGAAPLPPPAPPRPAPPEAIGHGAGAGIDPPGEDAAVIAPLRRILRDLPEEARAPLAAFLIRPEGPPALRAWLAAAVLIERRPDLAALPAELAAHVAALTAPAIAVRALAPESAAPGPAPPSPRRPRGDRPAEGPFETAAPAPVPRPADAAPPAPAPPVHQAPWAEGAASGAELPSAGAGLFLVVNALTRLGFAEWRAARPGETMAGFAPAFLAHLARRQRVARRDPLFAALGAGEEDPAWPPLFDAWRVGLDRWLRRVARRRLADLVARRGWLIWDEARIDIRYPLAAADLNLRRRALDVDPGWTPWLGRAVVYRFSDEVRR